MKVWIIAIAAALAASESRAGTLDCHFTEPFFNITFDSVTGRVVMTSADETDPDTGKPIPKVLAEGAKLRNVRPEEGWREFRVEKSGETILDLKLTGQGSDGMSDNVYPFEGYYGGRDGGCETAKYPAYDVYDLVEDLGGAG